MPYFITAATAAAAAAAAAARASKQQLQKVGSMTPQDSLPPNQTPLSFHPIGVMRSPLRQRYETPKQGVLATQQEGIIEIHPEFIEGLKGIEGFDRLWIIFSFHLNAPPTRLLIKPPHRRQRVGVFATRSPHRPNSIGMTCARLIKTEEGKLYIAETDILDGSPILDIKPYLPYCDAFQDAKTGWVQTPKCFPIHIEELAESVFAWIQKNTGVNLKGYTQVQLQEHPTNDKRKRITIKKEVNKVIYGVLSYRHWRIHYRLKEEAVTIERVDSVPPTDGLSGPVHEEFLRVFNQK